MNIVRFDPVAVWRGLSAETQERIGAAAVAQAVALIGVEEEHAPPGAFDATADEMECLIHDRLVDEAADQLFDEQGVPYVPDLRPLGVRQCRECGGTDRHIHAWAGVDLCAACADGGAT